MTESDPRHCRFREDTFNTVEWRIATGMPLLRIDPMFDPLRNDPVSKISLARPVRIDFVGLGSARASRAGADALVSADFSTPSSVPGKVRFGEAPLQRMQSNGQVFKPTREALRSPELLSRVRLLFVQTSRNKLPKRCPQEL